MLPESMATDKRDTRNAEHDAGFCHLACTISVLVCRSFYGASLTLSFLNL